MAGAARRSAGRAARMEPRLRIYRGVVVTLAGRTPVQQRQRIGKRAGYHGRRYRAHQPRLDRAGCDRDGAG
jgi:hypothetical protein